MGAPSARPVLVVLPQPRRRGRPPRETAELCELREEVHALHAEAWSDLAVLYPLARQFEFLAREYGPATLSCARAMVHQLDRMAARLERPEVAA